MDELTRQRLDKMDRQISAIAVSLKDVKDKLNLKPSLSDIARSENTLRGELDILSTSISMVEQQVAYVRLPEQTKWYLEESEVDQFRIVFSQLKAIIVEYNSLYSKLVAYQASL